MATTYLTLTNSVLRELNETELTSANFSSSRGIQTAVKDFINKSIHDIYNESAEIPVLFTRTNQVLEIGDNEYDFPADMRRVDFDSFSLKPKELITNGEFESNINSWTTISGSPAYSSAGNGRLSLSNASAQQSISTVVNKSYRIQVRALNTNANTDTLSIAVGSSAGGTQNLSSSITVSNYGEGNILDSTFTATATTTYIRLTTTGDFTVDFIRVSRNDIVPRKLTFLSYDSYLQNRKEVDDVNNSSQYQIPQYIYRLPNYSAFGVSPRPDSNEYRVEYDYYTTHTDLSAHGDNMALPDRFRSLIVDRAKYYTYMLRSDPQHAQLADRDYQRKLRLLKTDYATKADYMRTDVIAESISTNIGGVVR